MNDITNNKRKFKPGEYVTDGRDVFYVVDVKDDKTYGQLLHIEHCRSGMSYDMCEFRFYKKCKKPNTVRQDINLLAKKYAGPNIWERKLFRRFAGEVINLMRRHGHLS